MDELQDISPVAAFGTIPSGELLPLVYDELRHLAARRMGADGGEATFQPTGLVHEAWLKLSRTGPGLWNDRAHFFRAAAQAMRTILVDHARKKGRHKRGRGTPAISIEGLELADGVPDDRVLMVDEMLGQLEKRDEVLARVVSLKFFGGMTNRQIAGLNGVTERTVERQWAYAKLLLYEMIQQDMRGGAADEDGASTPQL